MPLTRTLVSNTTLGSLVAALPTPGLAKCAGNGAVQVARRDMFCFLPHPFDYAAQPLAWGQILAEITHFSFERFHSFKEFIHSGGAATGHRNIL